MTQPLRHPEPADLELAEVLHALSDPVRLGIVQELSGGARLSCGTLDVRVAKSTLSHHLRVLREAGVTLTEPDGTSRVLSLRSEDLDARFPGLLAAVLGAAPVRS